jgi:TP901 family phage tail tape measure protein
MSLFIGEISSKITADTGKFDKSIDQTKIRGERAADDISNKFHRLGNEFSVIGDKLTGVGKKMTTRLTLPLIAFGGLALRTAANFESSMKRVSAISGATGSALNDLEKQARDLGATTQFSASEAADAMTFLAMAGFEVNDIMGAMPSVLNLAAAAQLDMASAADIASNIMSGFGMSAEELEGAVDVLAKSFTSSNTNLLQLGEAMKLVGPVASSFKVQFEETAAAIGLLSDAGLQGSMAGTGLRRVISTLSRDADKLGVNVFNAAGNMRPLADIIEEIQASGISASRVMEIFGDRGGPAMSVLLSSGSEALREMTANLEQAGGTAQMIADKQMEGLSGALKELKSAFEELQLAIADSGLLDSVTSIVRRITDLTRAISDMNPNLLRTATIFGAFVAAAGPAIWAFGSFNKALGTALVLLPKVTTAQQGLNMAMRANIILGVASAVTALGIAAYTAEKRISDLRKATQDLLDADPATQSLSDVNNQITELAKRIESLKNVPDFFGIESRRIRAMEEEMENLLKRRDEIALREHITFVSESEKKNLEETTEEVIKLAEAIRSIKPTVDALPPTDEIMDLVALEEYRKELELLNMSVFRITDAWADYAYGAQVAGERTQEATLRGGEFANIMGSALAQATLHGSKLSEVVAGLIKQFASRAFVQGIAALLTGGGSLAGRGFFSAVFGGVFHGGGIVGGSGERMIKVKGGEGVFTPSQMNAMGRMTTPVGIDSGSMQRAFENALRTLNLSIDNERLYLATKQGERRYA